MADTFDKTEGGTLELPCNEAGYNFTLRRKYDCKTAALGGDGNVVSGDTLQMLNIPEDGKVEKVVILMTTVEGGTLTVDVGDGSDTDGFLDGANLNAAATKINTLLLTEAAPNTVLGYSDGKLYAAADTIDMLFNNAADTVVFEIIAYCIRFEKAAAENNALGST